MRQASIEMTLDLQERYKSGREEGQEQTRDPQFTHILCQHGHIYWHDMDGGVMGFSTDKRGGVARKLMGMAGVRTLQDGDDGVNVAFPAELFDGDVIGGQSVADIVKPRKRRRMSPEQREANRERLAQWQFQRHNA